VARAALVLPVLLAAAGLARQALAVQVEAPPALHGAAARVRAIDRRELAGALARAGLEIPPRVHFTLVPEDDSRASSTPRWIVGRAFGTEQVEIFPQRVSSYPYGSLDAVVRHEIVHLALTLRAGGRALPRWFHEGVATTVEGGWGFSEQVRLLAAALDRPTVTDVDRLFVSDSAPATAQAYVLAAALVNDLRERHGRDVPGRIAGHVANGLDFGAAFRRETGETVNEATTRAWTGYRRVSRWIPAATSSAALWLFILALSLVAFLAQLRRRLRQRRRWEEEGNDEFSNDE
jgi:hypothetical protein